MKFTMLALGLASLSSIQANAQSSQTQGSFDLKQLHADTLSLGDEATNCFNINGTWKGTCENRALGADQNQEVSLVPTEMTFSQKGCALIQAEQFGASYLGAVKTESISNQRGVFSQTGASYWLANGQKLGMNQSYSLVMYGDKGSVTVGRVQGNFNLEGEFLIGKITQNVTRMGMTGLKIGEVRMESNCKLSR